MPDYGRGKRPLDQPTSQERRLRDHRDAIYRVLDKLTDASLRVIVEHGERHPRGSVEGERAAGGGKGDPSDPTTRVALECLPSDPDAEDMWRERRDLVGRCIAELAVLLAKTATWAEAVDDKREFVTGLTVDEFEHLGLHKTAATCRACQRKVTGSDDDRLRSGYCNACRAAWARRLSSWNQPGSPDRVAFERERLAKADEEKKAS